MSERMLTEYSISHATSMYSYTNYTHNRLQLKLFFSLWLERFSHNYSSDTPTRMVEAFIVAADGGSLSQIVLSMRSYEYLV